MLSFGLFASVVVPGSFLIVAPLLSLWHDPAETRDLLGVLQSWRRCPSRGRRLLGLVASMEIVPCRLTCRAVNAHESVDDSADARGWEPCRRRNRGRDRSAGRLTDCSAFLTPLWCSQFVRIVDSMGNRWKAVEAAGPKAKLMCSIVLLGAVLHERIDLPAERCHRSRLGFLILLLITVGLMCGLGFIVASW